MELLKDGDWNVEYEGKVRYFLNPGGLQARGTLIAVPQAHESIKKKCPDR